MPCNEDAFTLVKYSLAGSKWKKTEVDGYKVEYDPGKVAVIMSSLGIKDKNAFEKAIYCLSEIYRESMD